MSVHRIAGDLHIVQGRFAIVAGRWNEIFVEGLVRGAIDTLLRHGAAESNITLIHVPGCFEIPLAALECARSKKFDAIITVGALIRGETDHYQLIASQLTSGIAQVMMETNVPVTFGVVTADNMEQAMARSGSKAGNKGTEAALAAIEMINVVGKIRENAK